MAKKAGSESKLIYVPFIILIVIIAGFIFMTTTPSHGQSEIPFAQFVKVSSTDYDSTPGQVSIYFISWYGCPLGATTSWPLYAALRAEGANLVVYPHYSIEGAIPGLIFNNSEDKISNDLVFHSLYLYNEYLNATPNGTPIHAIHSGGLRNEGLAELKSEAPSWLVNLVEKYQFNESATSDGSNLGPMAYYGNEPHIVTMLVITGPKGTWIMLGYPSSFISPQDVKSLGSPQQIYQEIQSGNIPTSILNAEQKILNIISEAE
ncbi:MULTISPECIES: DUF929 domain-containing protein [Acidianus]|uniref:DUF929 domain-containing protein n=1 Tax=Candidatus Acidianus copahuensis TaxID=1160895 RepID=A0A031LKK6_9CREN|nr:MULTISPECIES: DUF929 domain-containing protein [Acidianus]EZQ02025.1 hypothetical protein CM19_11160 [Candidatus Acidianus copahuensis]NON62372.1 DUF929 domain-containing protein [Acidianus sp. RZ1]